jgi:hypothetical protein
MLGISPAMYKGTVFPPKKSVVKIFSALSIPGLMFPWIPVEHTVRKKMLNMIIAHRKDVANRN